MKISRWLLAFLLFCCFSIYAQDTDNTERFRVMSYNTENFLDFKRDTLKNAPDSTNLPGWSYTRYRQKRNRIAQVIAAVGEWNPPVLVGLCEVGNRAVLDDLTRRSPLKELKYSIAHFESPDPRGIDVALLYQPYYFTPYAEQPIRIAFPNDPHRHTRDILYVGGTLRNGDTLHVFVNHFPSRMGGELESEGGRVTVATILRSKVDSLFAINRHAKIIIMGDFNDYPDNRSISKILGAIPDTETPRDGQLVNLFYTTHKAGKTGSYKHEGEWGMLDQILVSPELLSPESAIFTRPDLAHVFSPDFLLENDDKNIGKQPFRTFIGMKYHGGFSDHLPVYVDLYLVKKQ